MRVLGITFLLLGSALLAGCAGDDGAAKANCLDHIANADGTNAKHTKILVKTNKGDFKVELFDDVAPKTAENFREYAKTGYYDHVVFHRIIPDFMMQGGKFDNQSKMAKNPTRGMVTNEAVSSGCLNKEYTLSMARTQDPNSARAEFFVNFKDNTFLDPSANSPGYTVFGIVYEGRDTVDKIERVPIHVYNPSRDPMCQAESGNAPNCPDQPVEMIDVEVI